jgi:hypothetical protein
MDSQVVNSGMREVALANGFVLAVEFDSFLAIGPEFKIGVRMCVRRSDFENYKLPIGITYEGIDPELVKYVALYGQICKFHSQSPSDPEVARIAFLLASLPKLQIPLYVAKWIWRNGEGRAEPQLSQSRELYYSTLCQYTEDLNTSIQIRNTGIQVQPRADLPRILRCAVGAYFVSPYVSGILKHNDIWTEDEFFGVLARVIERVEVLAKDFNFIHGHLILAHVSKDGQFIDFGHSFSFRDNIALLDGYLKKNLPKSLYAVASEKAKIHQIDITISCTLLDIWIFLDSIDKDRIHKSFVQFRQKVIMIKDWIMSKLEDYYNSDVSIFEYFRTSTIVFGGCDGDSQAQFGLPPMYSRIEETFPTRYLYDAFCQGVKNNNKK